MGDGNHELDVTHPFATHLAFGDFHATSITNLAFIANSLVLPAVALPVFGRSENLLAKETVALRFIGAVVDGLRLEDLAMRLVDNRVGRRQAYGDFLDFFSCIIVFSESHIDAR